MRPALVLGPVLALFVLTGCGSYEAQLTAPGGADDTTGTIAVRDARISASTPRAGDEAYDAGEDAPLTLTIVNNGDATDRLLAVSSPVAEDASIDGDAQILGGFALVSGYDQVAPAQTLPATVRADITLTDLREPVRAGLTYPVTFTFERSGAVVLEVPVGNPDVPAPRATDDEPTTDVPGTDVTDDDVSEPDTPAAPGNG
ncbi:copper(I)-binding protein [Pseudonocardia sediminis]|uniref:Copper(I)-binding protein n=1 Tax=Pseudonocardia sediminis TaxID=1397368 RepID=A0A4Q7V1C1_PSEST|nr:copper chaperone PCu(A)C [Pseudonocardia sediminis]RZT86383.1 copper(I)-binding protein [Pseudonocardia sediminis]